MNKKEILSFFETLSSLNPNPKGELNYTNPYTLLVAVILSAQSTDLGVNKATHALFKTIKTPEDMVRLGEESLRTHIKTIGLYKTKAKNVLKASQRLIDLFNSTVPSEKKDLESLPGVGPKTANVVLNIAFNAEAFPVDTHVFRVCNRTGLAKGKTPQSIEKILEKKVPSPYRKNAHHWLILHGRYICKARAPLCETCPVSSVCDYFKRRL
ncbi:endonuclease III [Alphaproteobacteria bacterium]|nr:endonuclease III [Alphaproteobacteria bacterium]